MHFLCMYCDVVILLTSHNCWILARHKKGAFSVANEFLSSSSRRAKRERIYRLLILFWIIIIIIMYGRAMSSGYKIIVEDNVIKHRRLNHCEGSFRLVSLILNKVSREFKIITHGPLTQNFHPELSNSRYQLPSKLFIIVLGALKIRPAVCGFRLQPRINMANFVLV